MTNYASALPKEDRITIYSLGSAFNQTIKKNNRNKHVSFTKHNEVHQYNNNDCPIMVTYDYDTGGHYISKNN